MSIAFARSVWPVRGHGRPLPRPRHQPRLGYNAARGLSARSSQRRHRFRYRLRLRAGDGQCWYRIPRISLWNQYLGQQIILGSVSQTESLVVAWNTSGLTPATYTLEAIAHDAVGNWTRSQVTVNVVLPAPHLRVSDIIMTGRIQGTKATITGSGPDSRRRRTGRPQCHGHGAVETAQWFDPISHRSDRFGGSRFLHRLRPARDLPTDRSWSDQSRICVRPDRKRPHQEHHQVVSSLSPGIPAMHPTVLIERHRAVPSMVRETDRATLTASDGARRRPG
jgi:hypothetical protein